MSEIWRHLKFDFRRYWWLAAGALAILFFMPRLGQGFLALVVVPFLVMNHKTAGSGAWWLVRPLDRNRLVLAKLLEIAMLCAAAFAILSAGWLVKGFRPAYVALCELEKLPLLAAACGFTAILACLAKNFRGYFLLIPKVLIFAVGLVMVWGWAANLLIDWYSGPDIKSWFPKEMRKSFDDSLLINFYSSAGLFAVFWVHYRMRRPAWTVVLAGVAILAPIFWVTQFPPAFPAPHRGIGVDEIRPIKGFISIRENDLIPERQWPSSVNEFWWLAKLPLEIHFDEKLPEDEFLEISGLIHFAAADRPGKEKRKALPDRWHFNRERAGLHASGVSSAIPPNAGSLAGALIGIPIEDDPADWFDRPMALSKPLRSRMWQFRAHPVGTLDLEAGSIVSDGVNCFRIVKAPGENPDPGLAFRIERLRPRAKFNPAWRFAEQRKLSEFILWDSRNSESHLADAPYLSRGSNSTGDVELSSVFPSFPDWNRLTLGRLGDLKVLVIRHERLATREIEIKPGSFTIRAPEIEGKQGGRTIK